MTELVGPRGESLDKYFNKKSSPPKTGPSFGQWAGPDVRYSQLPGGGVVQFDLSKLTLADFRGMRDHYQVNASLAVLGFMQHQSDWHIECDNQTIADECEDQITSNWTGLNRAMGTSNWAGYSPSALEWDNDIIGRTIKLTKVKDLIPEDCRVNWKTVEGWAPPGRTPPKFKVYDGIRQYMAQGWPIPTENCVTPDTLILCADFSWRKAGDLIAGDEILAFDENERLKGRRYRKATVEANRLADSECITIESRDGDPITVSAAHPFLVRRGPLMKSTALVTQSDGITCPNCGAAITQTGRSGAKKKFCTERCQMLFAKVNSDAIYKDRWEWTKACDLKIGDKIGFFGKPSQRDESREAGYVAGIFDGEGSLTFNGDGNSVTLAFSQNTGVVLTETCRILDAKGFDYSMNSNKRDSNIHVVIAGGRREIARFMEVFAPERLKVKTADLFDETVMRIERSVSVTEVSGIFDAGTQQVANLQTTTSTYISAGYLSHNSLWYPLLMENGDYYGRKLLKPAFQSWFFSILLHLFANRYYERFGEPTPIGRAPYDEEITVDNKQINGSEFMLNLLQQLRSRSVVVLPNDRQMGTSNSGAAGKPSYDYDIEYLESQMRGADFERYMTRLDEEISIGLFTPILLLRTADVGSYSLGQGHMQMYLWMLNAMNDDRKTYLDKYILSKMVDYNFGPNAPRAKIVFRKMGNTSGEMLSSLLTTLVNKGGAKVDIKELGQMVGMTLSEVEQTVAAPGAPADPNAPTPDPNASPPAPTTGNARLPMPLVSNTVEEIVDRVRGQIEAAFREDRFNSDLQVNMGYKRKFERALSADGSSAPVIFTDLLYKNMDNWLQDTVALGSTEFSSPDSFMGLFERVLGNEVNDVSRLIGAGK